MIWIRARIDLFAISALLGIFAFVMGLVSCDSSHVSMADCSYVQPASNSMCEIVFLQITQIDGMAAACGMVVKCL